MAQNTLQLSWAHVWFWKQTAGPLSSQSGSTSTHGGSVVGAGVVVVVVVVVVVTKALHNYTYRE